MRWDELFSDLEGQFAAEEQAHRLSEVNDRTRRETARLHLLDRLRGSMEQELRVAICGAGAVTGRLVELGADWLLLRGDGTRETLVALPAVLWLRGLRPESLTADVDGPVAARLSMRYVLRALARERCGVVLVFVDGGQASGTIARVGGDFLELAEHPMGEPCRTGEVLGSRVVPLGSLAVVWRTS